MLRKFTTEDPGQALAAKHALGCLLSPKSTCGFRAGPRSVGRDLTSQWWEPQLQGWWGTPRSQLPVSETQDHIPSLKATRGLPPEGNVGSGSPSQGCVRAGAEPWAWPPVGAAVAGGGHLPPRTSCRGRRTWPLRL